MHGPDLAADGKRLLVADGRSASLGEVGHCEWVLTEVLLAAAQHHWCSGMMPTDLPHPLVLDVVQRDGVGDLVAEEEDVGVVVGQGANRVVGGRPCSVKREGRFVSLRIDVVPLVAHKNAFPSSSLLLALPIIPCSKGLQG